MRVLLLHPPARSELAVYRTESVGLGYIAAVLRRDGHEVEIVDANVRSYSPRKAISEVLAREFACLGITALHEHRHFVLAAARAVRQRKRNVLITVGGYLPTLAPELLLRACPELDFVVRGEGEIVISEALARMSRNEDWRGVPGLAYMKDNEPVLNPLPPVHADLDALPFPARDVLIANPWMDRAPFSSSRGCYHQCSFCTINEFYALAGAHGSRCRGAANVVDEMESVLASTGIDYFVFSDDDFIGPGEKARERAIRIGDEIIARKLKIRFSFECRADEADKDMLKRLMEAGLDAVFLGLESGSQSQLDRFGKRTTVEQNRQAIEAVTELGLKMDVGFIMFDPYTTMEELEENMRFVRENKLSVPMIRLQLFPGLRLVDRLREDGLLIERGLDLDYKFRNPRIAQAYKVMHWSMTARNLVARMKERLGLSSRRSPRAGGRPGNT